MSPDETYPEDPGSGERVERPALTLIARIFSSEADTDPEEAGSGEREERPALTLIASILRSELTRT